MRLWYDEPNPPEALEDFPMECMFCGEIVALGENEPVCVRVYPYVAEDVQTLCVTHRKCFAERTLHGEPEWWANATR